MLLEQYDRSGMSGVKFAQYVGSTLAYWLQSRRRKREWKELLMKAGADIEPGKSNGAWIEAVVQNGSEPGVPKGALRIYFGGGAYCQISSATEAALAAELLGRLATDEAAIPNETRSDRVRFRARTCVSGRPLVRFILISRYSGF